jgi:hypothetical protein
MIASTKPLILLARQDGCRFIHATWMGHPFGTGNSDLLPGLMTLMRHLYLGASFHLVFECRSRHLAGKSRFLRPRFSTRDASMFSENHDATSLRHQLRAATAVTPNLIAEFIDQACRRYPSRGQAAKTARIEQLIDARAWTDVALALIDLELPLWRIRRIAYDAGEWYCALSRQCELPDWLDQASEGRHADLTLAILSAFVEAQAASASPSQPSVPTVARKLNPLYDPLGCDNFA